MAQQFGPDGSRLPSGHRESIFYASKGEGATSIMFSRYIPGWRPVLGKTFLIPIGWKKQCDFRVGDLLVEYHPPAIEFEMRNKNAKNRLLTSLEHCSYGTRAAIEQALKDEFALRYYEDRLRHLREHGPDEVRNLELIVVQTPQQVYNEVVVRFGKERLPSKQRFCEEWFQLVRSAAIPVR